MTEFKTADELMEHYRSLKNRLMPRRVPLVTILPPPPAPVAPPIIKELPPPPTTKVIIKEPENITSVIKAIRTVKNDEGIYEGRINWADVVGIVVGWSGMSIGEIFCRRRDKKSSKVRQILWALAVEHCKHLSTPRIGRISKSFEDDDGYDHSTILYGAEQGRKMLEFVALSKQLSELKVERTIEALKENCKKYLL